MSEPSRPLPCWSATPADHHAQAGCVEDPARTPFQATAPYPSVRIDSDSGGVRSVGVPAAPETQDHLEIVVPHPISEFLNGPKWRTQFRWTSTPQTDR